MRDINTSQNKKDRYTPAKIASPRGGTQQSFIRGGSAPRSNPLPFYIPFYPPPGSVTSTFYLQLLIIVAFRVKCRKE